MSETKRDVVRELFEKQALTSIANSIAEMPNREHAEAIRLNRRYIASQIAWRIYDEYVFLELADIMEWKRTRARR